MLCKPCVFKAMAMPMVCDCHVLRVSMPEPVGIYGGIPPAAAAILEKQGLNGAGFMRQTEHLLPPL